MQKGNGPNLIRSWSRSIGDNVRDRKPWELAANYPPAFSSQKLFNNLRLFAFCINSYCTRRMDYKCNCEKNFRSRLQDCSHVYSLRTHYVTHYTIWERYIKYKNYCTYMLHMFLCKTFHRDTTVSERIPKQVHTISLPVSSITKIHQSNNGFLDDRQSHFLID